MTQLAIIHKESAKPIALKLYAFFRNRFPDATIKPNVNALITDGISVGQGIFNTNVVVAIVSQDWHSDWIHNADDIDTLALRATLTTNTMLYVLRLNGTQLPQDLPDNLSTLRNMMSFDVTDENVYEVLETLSNFITPMLPNQTASLSDLVKSPATISYAPNPIYPDSDRIIHLGISPTAFQHPLDKMATENLKKINGFDFLMKRFLEFGFERVQQVLYAASSIKVGPNQYPKLYSMLEEATQILDMPMPDMYVILGDQVNAFTFGHTRPYIVIYSPLLDMMSDDETMAIIAHELGHIKCSHVLYNTMAQFAVPLVSGMVGSIPVFGDIGKIAFDVGIQVALLTWSRRSELSADRASLLVMQNPEPCISMLAKLAGGSVHLQGELSLEAFIEQAKEYDFTDDKNNVDKFYRIWAFMQQTTHPFPVERARFLNDYIDGLEFEQIMNGIYPRIDNLA